jgi:hypothetical protein
MSKIFILFSLFQKKFFSIQICTEGENNCAKCFPVLTLCIKCKKEIYFPNNNGGTEFSRKYILGKKHCILCNEEENLCKSCNEDYFPDKNVGCSYTDNCEISYKENCLQCIDNFSLIK